MRRSEIFLGCTSYLFPVTLFPSTHLQIEHNYSTANTREYLRRPLNSKRGQAAAHSTCALLRSHAQQTKLCQGKTPPPPLLACFTCFDGRVGTNMYLYCSSTIRILQTTLFMNDVYHAPAGPFPHTLLLRNRCVGAKTVIESTPSNKRRHDVYNKLDQSIDA